MVLCRGEGGREGGGLRPGWACVYSWGRKGREDCALVENRNVPGSSLLHRGRVQRGGGCGVLERKAARGMAEWVGQGLAGGCWSPGGGTRGSPQAGCVRQAAPTLTAYPNHKAPFYPHSAWRLRTVADEQPAQRVHQEGQAAEGLLCGHLLDELDERGHVELEGQRQQSLHRVVKQHVTCGQEGRTIRMAC